MEVLKVKDWLDNERPQFEVLNGALQEQEPDTPVAAAEKYLNSVNLTPLRRLKDNKILLTNFHFSSDRNNSSYFFINNLHSDCIHIDYTINPGIIKGTCEIDELYVSDDKPPFVYLKSLENENKENKGLAIGQ